MLVCEADEKQIQQKCIELSVGVKPDRLDMLISYVMHQSSKLHNIFRVAKHTSSLYEKRNLLEKQVKKLEKNFFQRKMLKLMKEELSKVSTELHSMVNEIQSPRDPAWDCIDGLLCMIVKVTPVEVEFDRFTVIIKKKFEGKYEVE
jgi:hypothetical protein